MSRRVVAPFARMLQRGGPWTETVVVFGGQDGVARAGIGTPRDGPMSAPRCSVVERADEVVVGGIRAAGLPRWCSQVGLPCRRLLLGTTGVRVVP